jgi:hypothetical protein
MAGLRSRSHTGRLFIAYSPGPRRDLRTSVAMEDINTSGQGAAAIVPPEVDRWNWGAMFLNWIWGIGNNTFIALLMFVPLVNIVMPFVLGAKGSAWAWRNKRWASVEQFKRVQRLWAIWGLVAFVALVGFVATVMFTVSTVMKQSEIYQMAVAQVQSSAQAVEALGTPITAGSPSGKIETSGPNGKAELEFSVQGPKAKGMVYLRGIKDFGAWKLERIELQIEGRGRIILGEAAVEQGSQKV